MGVIKADEVSGGNCGRIQKTLLSSFRISIHELKDGLVIDVYQIESDCHYFCFRCRVSKNLRMEITTIFGLETKRKCKCI